MNDSRVIIGDCRQALREVPDGCVQCCVTSPPYYGLRDYKHADQIGQEATPEEYVQALVQVFAEVRRVLRADGTLWLNLGDSYADKRLLGMPWRVAFALGAAGWILRSDVIWAKPNPMPEPVTDRPTKAHEYLFLLAQGDEYFYDADAIREQISAATIERFGSADVKRTRDADKRAASSVGNAGDSANRGLGTGAARSCGSSSKGRNARSVWSIYPLQYGGAHFATMPPELVTRCILAGSRIGDLVLDPFFGSGTVGEVAESLGRRWLGCELNPDYHALIKARTAQTGLRFGGDR